VIATGNPGDLQGFQEKSDYNRLRAGRSVPMGCLFAVPPPPPQEHPDIRIRKAAAMAIDKGQHQGPRVQRIGLVRRDPFPETACLYTTSTPRRRPDVPRSCYDQVQRGGDNLDPRSSPSHETSNTSRPSVAGSASCRPALRRIVNATERQRSVQPLTSRALLIYTAGLFAIIDRGFEYTLRYQSTPCYGTGFQSDELDKWRSSSAPASKPELTKAAYDQVQQILADNVVQYLHHDEHLRDHLEPPSTASHRQEP